MWPSIDVNNQDDDPQGRPNVVQYLVKVWPHCLLGFIKIRPAFPRAWRVLIYSNETRQF